jgi:hypothetical protein
MSVTVSEVFNGIDFTDSEANCMLHFIQEVQQCGYPSANQDYYPTINTILNKYYTRLQQLDSNCTFVEYDY